MNGIADTGFLVAFANANDKHHKWSAQLATGVTEPLLTCEAVIAETAFHLESAAVALAMVNEGLVALAFDCREHLGGERGTRTLDLGIMRAVSKIPSE